MTLPKFWNEGIVIDADITISIDDAEPLGIEIRAAIASFETAAQYGFALPRTGMRRVELSLRACTRSEMRSTLVSRPAPIGARYHLVTYQSLTLRVLVRRRKPLIQAPTVKTLRGKSAKE